MKNQQEVNNSPNKARYSSIILPNRAHHQANTLPNMNLKKQQVNNQPNKTYLYSNNQPNEKPLSTDTLSTQKSRKSQAKSKIITPRKLQSQDSINKHTPVSGVQRINGAEVYTYSQKAIDSLHLYEIDNAKNYEQRELRKKFMLPPGVMLFKAGKIESSRDNPILGPFKYSEQRAYFGNGPSVFIGQYFNGSRNGIGHEIFEDGSGFHGNYINDIIIGRGRIVSSNGDYYHGDFKNGKPHGLGILYSVKEQLKYEGAFHNGEKSGFGSETRRDGTEYVGNFMNNKWDGKGVMKHPDGRRYKGMFRNGLMEGEGILTE